MNRILKKLHFQIKENFLDIQILNTFSYKTSKEVMANFMIVVLTNQS